MLSLGQRPVQSGVRLAFVIVLAGALLAAAGGAARAAVSADQQTALLNAQNTLRRTVATAETQRLGQPVTLPDLTWNAAAATVAQGWADHLLSTNTFDHNATRGDLGENIYMEGGSDPATSAPRAVAAWAGEAADYSWDTNACRSVCGHYTQLVWAATTSVGCGTATNGTFTFWVCDYAPPGNFVGQRPYEPSGPATAPANPAGATTPPPADTTPTQTTPPTGAPAAGVDLTGSWTVDDFGAGAGGTLTLTQVGTTVAGTYAYAAPIGCGLENGMLMGTLTGSVLTFTTSETGCAGTGGGGATVMVAPDGNSFSGGGAWDGKRTGP